MHEAEFAVKTKQSYGYCAYEILSTHVCYYPEAVKEIAVWMSFGLLNHS